MPVATHRVDAMHWAAGRSIGELNLRADTNASILAIARDGAVSTTLSPEDRIAEGDVLYLTGDESDVLLARERLTSGGSP